MSDLAVAPEAAGDIPAVGEHEFNALQILTAPRRQIRWIVEDLIPPGLCILAGMPKLGKSQLALNLGVWITLGESAFGKLATDQGDVVYYDLEDGRDLVEDRMHELFPSGSNFPTALSGLDFKLKAPRLNNGLLDAFEKWRAGVKRPRLIIVDLYENVRAAAKSGQNAYSRDYDSLSPVKEWAMENHLCVMLILHKRKDSGVDDPLASITGSQAMAGAADTILLLRGNEQEMTLFKKGRRIKQNEVVVQVEAKWFKIIGDVKVVREMDLTARILQVFKEHRTVLGPTQISDYGALNKKSVRNYLGKLSKPGGRLLKVEHGFYRLNPGYIFGDNDDKMTNDVPKGAETLSFQPPINVISDVTSDKDVPFFDEYDEVFEAFPSKPDNVISHSGIPADDNSEMTISEPVKQDVSAISKVNVISNVNVTEVEGIDRIDPSSVRFLTWLSSHLKPVDHSTALMNLNKALNAEQIDVAVKDLYGRGLMTVTLRTGGNGADVPWYACTDEGRRVARTAKHPGQPDLLAHV